MQFVGAGVEGDVTFHLNNYTLSWRHKDYILKLSFYDVIAVILEKTRGGNEVMDCFHAFFDGYEKNPKKETKNSVNSEIVWENINSEVTYC